MEQPQHLLPGYMMLIIWAALAAVSYLVFMRRGNVVLKRKLWPLFMIVAGALFLYLAWASGMPAKTLKFAAPVVVLITLLNIFTARFCDACGVMVVRKRGEGRPEHCATCGAKLNP